MSAPNIDLTTPYPEMNYTYAPYAATAQPDAVSVTVAQPGNDQNDAYDAAVPSSYGVAANGFYGAQAQRPYGLELQQPAVAEPLGMSRCTLYSLRVAGAVCTVGGTVLTIIGPGVHWVHNNVHAITRLPNWSGDLMFAIGVAMLVASVIIGFVSGDYQRGARWVNRLCCGGRPAVRQPA